MMLMHCVSPGPFSPLHSASAFEKVFTGNAPPLIVTAEYPTKLTLFAPAYMQNPCDPSGKTVFARFACVVPQ